MSPLIRFPALCTIGFGLLCMGLAGPVAAVELRDLNSHCPFTPPTTVEAWQARAADLKLQLQAALGLYPQIELDPVEPQIYGRVIRDDYSIDKVIFESLPGFYVTGNLYRPKASPAGSKLPAVLCPHGHWENARFYDAQASVKNLLADGSERFENAARNHIQARCVQLARMGCIVFHWDMIGYCDSTQISFERAHRFGKQPAETEVTADGWLLFSPLAESHGQSILGLQTLAIHRAVDMLLGMPDVDPRRIAISGASGGGTQSFLGAATDERISLAFPAVMVSTGMQGGCTCENACWLRTGTGNVEMAALIAPRPLGLTAANDWTKTMPTDGFPQLQQLYGLLGAPKQVALFPAVHFGHNFNHVSRVGLYGWVSDHFGLGFDKPVLERDFQIALRDELSVWDAKHPQPAGGEEFERKLMKLWAEIIDRQLLTQLQGDAAQLGQLAQTLSAGWRVCLGLTTNPQLTEAQAESVADGLKLQVERLPAWRVSASAPSQAAIAATNQSTSRDEQAAKHQAIMQAWDPAKGSLRIEVAKGDGAHNFYLELAGQSWSDTPEQVQQQSLVANPRLAAAYTFGYNLPLFATRAQQLGHTLRWLAKQHPQATLTVHGTGSTAALAAAGGFVAQHLATASQQPALALRLNLQPEEFAFAKVDVIRHPDFLPLAARFWDLPGLVATTPAKIRLSGTAQALAPYRKLADLAQISAADLVFE